MNLVTQPGTIIRLSVKGGGGAAHQQASGVGSKLGRPQRHALEPGAHWRPFEEETISDLYYLNLPIFFSPDPHRALVNGYRHRGAICWAAQKKLLWSGPTSPGCWGFFHLPLYSAACATAWVTCG